MAGESGRTEVAVHSVLVSHPHVAAVAVGCAEGLERAGRLAAFFTGVAASNGGWSARLLKKVSPHRPVLLNRIVDGIAAERLVSMPCTELMARAIGTCARTVGMPSISTYDAVFLAHDLQAARARWPAATDAVYAYEDAAHATFRAARRHGMACFWDLPLPHYKCLDDLRSRETRRWPTAADAGARHEPAWKIARKDHELSLADHVFVASKFTRESLEAIGFRRPIHVIPYGFPVARFTARASRPRGPFTVLAVGSHNLRKGTPYLLEAFLQAGIPDARLRLVGPLPIPSQFLARYRGLYEHVPHVPKAFLQSEYAAADLLAFPTLGDGFGLVMQEAMCCGTPVLTTRCGGGPEVITSGVDGIIVQDANVDALVEALRYSANARDSLWEMGRRARQRAEQYSWIDAGQAYAEVMGRL